MDLGDIRNVNAGAFGDLATSLSSRVASIEDAQSAFAKITQFSGWGGSAKDAATQSFQNMDASLRDDIARLSAVRETAAELHDGFTQLQAQLRALEHEADALGATIDDNGFVHDKPDAHISDAQRARIANLSAEASEIIRAANRLDDTAADVLTRAAEGTITAGGAADDAQAAQVGERQGELGVPDPPPSTAAPDYNTGWWDSLPPKQRQWVIDNHPDWIGGRDGVSAAARDAANRKLLPAERARLTAERDRLQHELDSNPFGGAFSDKDAQLWYVKKKLEDLDAIDRSLNQYGKDAKLLVLDMRSGERGKAAIALGDPDVADHISVTTPGLDSSVGGSINGMVDEANKLKRETEQILTAQHKPGETVSTIAWIGYQCPQTDGPGWGDWARGTSDVSHDALAKAGAQDLSRFYQGLNSAWRPADGHPDTGPQITALGHSYGSLTTSLALQQTPPGVVQNAVFYGSPGIEADSAQQLHLEAGHIFAMRGDQDWIGIPAGTGNFGADPAAQSWVTRLSTHGGITQGDSLDGSGVSHEGVNEDGGWWYFNHEHSQYPQNGSNGELRMPGYNMAAVIAGMTGDDGRNDVTRHGE